MTGAAIDLDRLLKLRVIVARFGEADLANWWYTRGQLGRHGASALKRGFPRTHYFAQARSVFAVASHRCREVFDAPGAVTLWRLPEAIEEEFDARWEYWLDNAAEWTLFFDSVASLGASDLPLQLTGRGLVGQGDLEDFRKLKRSAEGRSVMLPGMFSGAAHEIALLALGFGRGEAGALAVPHMRLQ
jgi:hypothetical protein